MCEPFTLAVATGFAVAGSVVGGAAAYRQARFQQSAAQRHADVMGMAAGDARLRGDAEAQRVAARGSQVIGAQKAAAGASGVDIASGSPAQLINASSGKVELDVKTAQNNAAREAWGYETEQTNAQLQASQAGSAADYALVGGALGAAGSALGGGARTYKAYRDRGGWFG